ncbi:hypothetical protein JTE90_023416, partial [Oedothorax gibbosus]
EKFLNVSQLLCENEKTFLETQDGFVCLDRRNIFFVETSGRENLSYRQACAVESAARHNPSFEVFVLATSIKTAVSSDLAKHLTIAYGVRNLRIDYGSVVYGTPLWNWYKSEDWKKSQHQVVHLSDAMRLLLLWRHGGIYLDLDVVVLQPLDQLTNCTPSDNGINASNMFLAFSRFHPFLKKCISDLADTYDANGFAANGPVLLTKNIRKLCKGVKVSMETPTCGIRVLPTSVACPIPYERWKEYFDAGTNRNMDLSQSYMIHIWNKMSSGEKLVIGGGSLYERAMKANCPITYQYTEQLESI